MLKRTKVAQCLLAAFGGSLALAALPSLAQDATRVEVTGSRIKTVQTESASPVITLNAEAIKVEGVRNVESLLNNLPQVFADYGASVSNGASGTATTNLRNLGPDRTLVLINGRRMPAGSPRLAAPDLNQIPVSLVKRVDVLTGGASAVYGSDAVAGVINFVLDDSFQGFQIEANHSFYNHQQNDSKGVQAALKRRNFAIPGDKSADGEVTDVSVTFGGNFANGKGNATGFFGFKREKALLQSERDFSACSLGAAGNVFNCGGSGTSFPGQFITDNGAFTVADANGNTRPYTAATDIYNFGPLNYFQRPSDRYTAAAFMRYDINDMARAYLETTFHDDSTVAQIAPSGLFGVAANVGYDNPLLSPAWRTAIGLNAPGDSAEVVFLRRNVEGGGRQDDVRHTSFRTVVGVKGDIGAFSYDAFAQVGKVIYQETYKNDFSITRAGRAMDVVADANGQAVCRSVLDGSDPNCVPYNIWKLGGVTPEALNYLQTPGFQKGSTSQQIIGSNVSIDLGKFGAKLPTAKEGLNLLVGFERRQEKLILDTDSAFTTGDLAGQGGPTIGVSGGYSVRDLFAELRVPLVAGMPGIEKLDLQASYRNSDYSLGPKTDTYGLGLNYTPVKAVSLRGSYQRAVRAPNVIELFSSQALGLFNADLDPCAGATPTATREQCARTGVTSAQYGTILDNPAGQYNQLTGGNLQLRPETADSVTFGLVFQPFKDLDLTVDYFKLKIEDGIGTIDPNTTLEQCLQSGNPVFCSKIRRDGRGTLWLLPEARIEANNANLSKEKTEGIDIGANYRQSLGSMGRLDLSLIGTWLKTFEQEPTPGLGTYDCVGYWGATCGTPIPKWRHKLRTTWSTPWNADLSLSWRYIGKVDHEVTSTNPLLAGTVNAVQANWGAVNYFDLAARYSFNKNLTLRVAINNLFDKDPPLGVTGAPFGNGNTYPVVYDALGRKISLNLVASF